jgi:hypothetical protein
MLLEICAIKYEAFYGLLTRYFPTSDSSAVARYVTPNGTEIQGIGLTPDISGNMPAPVVVPVLSSDTSKVDFTEIAKRLDPSFCKVPLEHTTGTTRLTSSAL